MDLKTFRSNAHLVVDWMADYLEEVEKYPVKSQVAPHHIYRQIPDKAPENAEPFKDIMADLNTILMPGITHWQHPNFHAYFPGNSSPPSVLGEMITAALGAQCMMWETSPAAAELEQRMTEWMKQAMDLPTSWDGCLQDTASIATLTALVSAREKITSFLSNEAGIRNSLRVYCSTETHSSVEKGIKIAGFGRENLVKIEVDDRLAMIPEKLEEAILADIQQGYTPCCVISTLGTTGTLAFDPTETIGSISKKYHLWLHVDAAFAGSAMILPECRWLNQGLQLADSFVFNPHKWLFTNFDCSCYFVQDKETLLRTFEIMPEYLKTPSRTTVNNYKDWGIPLGRRFRALKLWMVLRTYGISGLQEKLRTHLNLARWLEDRVKAEPGMQLMAPRQLNLIVFRMFDPNKSPEQLDTMNQALLNKINESGQAYLSHTRINGAFCLRLVVGQTNVEERHVKKVWELIEKTV